MNGGEGDYGELFLLAIKPLSESIGEGVLPEEIERVIQAREELGLKCFSHIDLLSKWFDIKTIKTGSKKLDEILDGGVQSMKVYEFYGPAGSGKTQICMQLSINSQLIEDSMKVAYIDTEKSFNVRRLAKLAGCSGLNEKLALKGVLYSNVSTLQELQRRLNSVMDLAANKEIILLIIDNFISPFQLSFRDLTSIECQREIYRVGWMLLRIACEYNVSVVITNKVYSIPDKIAGEKLIPFGGMALEKIAHRRVFLRKVNSNVFQAERINGESKSVFFKIDEKGVRDIE